MLKAETSQKELSRSRSSIAQWSLIAASVIFLAGAYPVWIHKTHSQPQWANKQVVKKPAEVRIKTPAAEPATKADPEPVKTVVPAPKPAEPRIVEGEVSQNDTFAALLDREGVGSRTVHEIVRAARPVFNLNRIRKGNPYRIAFDGDDRMLYLDYSLNGDQYLRVKRDGASFKPSLLDVHYDIETEIIEGEIRNNLISAVRKAGGTVQTAFDLTEIFSWDIDFFKDIRKGDSFQLIVEKKFRRGRFSGYGRILAARFVNRGEEYKAIYFENKVGGGNYFDLDGKPLEKQFLKAPLSSGEFLHDSPIADTIRSTKLICRTGASITRPRQARPSWLSPTAWSGRPNATAGRAITSSSSTTMCTRPVTRT